MDRSVDRLSWPKTGSYDVHSLGVLCSLAKEFSSDIINIPDSYNVFQKIVLPVTPEKFTSRPLGTSLYVSKALLQAYNIVTNTTRDAPTADFIFPPPRVEDTAAGAGPSASALSIIGGGADNWRRQYPGAVLSFTELAEVTRCFCLCLPSSLYVCCPFLSNAAGCLVLLEEALLETDPFVPIALQFSR